MTIEIEQKDIDNMDKELDLTAKNIIFNIKKYTVAVLPIIIPFALAYIITNDIVMSVVTTLIVDGILLLGTIIYVVKKKPELIKQ